MAKRVSKPLRMSNGIDFWTGKVIPEPKIKAVEVFELKRKEINKRTKQTMRSDGKVYVDWLGWLENFIN